MPSTVPEHLAGASVCCLETIGRVSGRPHEIEIWFAMHDDTLYLISGGGDRADWVRNIRRNAAVKVRIGDRTWHGIGRVVTGEADDPLARRALVDKYQRGRTESLIPWARNGTPVAIDLHDGVAKRGFE